MDYSVEEIAGLVDHALLQPTLTAEALEEGCRVAATQRVASVCVKPYWLARCAELLDGSGVLPSTTIGFPHGGHVTSVKVAEAGQAIADGGVELDMVVNIGRVLDEAWDYVRDDIAAVLAVTRAGSGELKVIFENCYLNDDHRVRLCEIASELEVDFVKTSTGFGSGGATVEDVRLMRERCPVSVGVKAAGGIASLDDLLEMRTAGASRIGASRTVEILDECRRRVAAGETD